MLPGATDAGEATRFVAADVVGQDTPDDDAPAADPRHRVPEKRRARAAALRASRLDAGHARRIVNRDMHIFAPHAAGHPPPVAVNAMPDAADRDGSNRPTPGVVVLGETPYALLRLDQSVLTIRRSVDLLDLRFSYEGFDLELADGRSHLCRRPIANDPIQSTASQPRSESPSGAVLRRAGASRRLAG